MKPSRKWTRPLALPALALGALCALTAFTACDRLAGTEVGNPEITVAARFLIQDTDTSASIPEMDLKLMGLGWKHGGLSGACWNQPDGHMVDFAAGTDPALPKVTVHNADWDEAEMTLQAPTGDLSLPDSAGFAQWSNPSYIKLVKTMGADTVRALFRLTGGMRIKLGFNQATIAKWRSEGAVTVVVRFDAGKWAAGLGSDPRFVYRTDGKQARYVLLSPDENAAAYRALMDLLPQSFMADAAEMQ